MNWFQKLIWKPDPVVDWNNTCSGCLFFFPEDASNAAQGACRRNPQAVIVGTGHWCGEWRPENK